MENFEGHPPSTKLPQSPEKAIGMKTQSRVGTMKSILQIIQPIEGVFNPGEEVKKLWSVPKEQRSESISRFKETLARQRKAWALCRTSIEAQIESKPDLPRQEMVETVREFATHYGFAKNHVKVAESLIDDYLEMHRRVNEARKKYPDDVALINRLTGMKFTASDAEDFTVKVGSVSIEISCSGFNAGKIYNKSQEPAVGFDSNGFATASSDSEPVYYIVVVSDQQSTNLAWYESTVWHEREHQKNKILAPSLYGKGKVRTDVRIGLNRGVFGFLRHQIGERLLGFERKFDEEVFERYKSAKDLEEKAFFLGEYMRLKREDALNRAKNEIIALKSKPAPIYSAYDVLLNQKREEYDYLASLRDWNEKKDDPLWQVTAKRVLVDEYRDVIGKAIIAFDKLRRSGYSDAITIAMLSDKRLADWPKTVIRLTEEKQNKQMGSVGLGEGDSSYRPSVVEVYNLSICQSFLGYRMVFNRREGGVCKIVNGLVRQASESEIRMFYNNLINVGLTDGLTDGLTEEELDEVKRNLPPKQKSE